MKGVTQAVRVINNSDRSIRGTERAYLLSMPPSTSGFKVSIHKQEAKLAQPAFCLHATAFSTYHSGNHSLF